jgi:glyoxylase-like metal-dependent hydrolase (beta-lactamase superfamily II)
MIETPGHTHGHSSILLRTDQGYILFAGDVVYHQSQILKGKFAGANVNFKLAEETYMSILEFSKNNKLVFLPSHDIDAGKRLQAFSELKVANR